LARALDEILPEAFAAVKNACRRLNDRKTEIIVREHPMLWEMIPSMCNSSAAMAPQRAHRRNGHRRRQNTVATLPIYLNALTGRGVHLVTVNDTSPRATPNGWGRFTNFWVDRRLHFARPAATRPARAIQL